MTGREWIVDAYGCAPESLQNRERMERLFDRLIEVLELHPVHEPHWYHFPPPGGFTGMVILQESHLTVHTFPEYGSMCLNLFSCTPKPEFNFVYFLAREFGATSVRVRKMDRNYSADQGRT